MSREQEGLPEGWARGTLGVVADLNMGQSPPGSATNTEGVGVPLVGGAADLKAIHPTPSKHTSAATKLCGENDIILCIRATIGRTAIADQEYCLGRGVAGLTARAVQRDWLRHYMTAAEQQLMDLGTGTTFKQVSKDTLTHFGVPVAPLNEQRRIVAKIESLQERSDSAKKALDAIPPLLERFRQSVLAAAFRGDLTKDWRAKNPNVESASVLLERIREERKARFIEDAAEKGRAKAEAKANKAGKAWTAADDAKALEKERLKAAKKYKAPEPVDAEQEGLPELPEGWCWARVYEVGQADLGRQRSPKNHRGPHMRPYLRVQNVFEDRIDVTDVMEMNFEPDEYQRYKLAHGDILLNEGQSKHLVGRPAMFRDEIPGACFTNTLVRYRPFQGVDRIYALNLFRCYMRTGRFEKIAKITTNIAHLGAERFRRVEFPLPPMAEQVEIGRVVGALMSVVDKQEDTLCENQDQLSSLNQSILAKAFRGELVPQDPTDEPASVLLERIRAERAQAEAEKKAAKKRKRKKA